MRKCTPGHALQCHLSKHPVCTCACKGDNHGQFERWWKAHEDSAEQLRHRIRRGAPTNGGTI